MRISTILTLAISALLPAQAETIFIEAESFSDLGGWKTDTQFIESMGSPYLLAHGLGVPVRDAKTTVTITEDGEYTAWVRTVDWSERLGRAEGAGRFALSLNGTQVGEELGNGEPNWTWQKAGSLKLPAGENQLALHDLTGFNGRVDAVLLTSDAQLTPQNDSTPLAEWRAKLLGHTDAQQELDGYDLVVVGGGYGGMGAAISAARMGAKVAIIQNRPVFGGNGSSEIRVWAMGTTPPSEYALGDIVHEVADAASKSPALGEEFGDDKKDQVLRAEDNIDIFLNHHAYGVEMKDGSIAGVKVFEVPTSQPKMIRGKFFADCTGHGFLGLWSGADTEMLEKGRMGMSNMWAWESATAPSTFPDEPWMLDLKEGDFPFPRDHHAQWFWESGFDKHPIDELEITRDWNLVASYSAWSAMKNHGAYAERDPQKLDYEKARLTWLAYIGGTRETLQILGDVVLTKEEIESKKAFPDGCVLTTWTIDLHIPNPAYEHVNPEHPFIAEAIHTRTVDRKAGYPIPYRSFYSRNIPNLFMAGRNISVTHEALGTIRVMKTIGMMGVVVGRAAALATELDCTPRELYENHLDLLKASWRAPGATRFNSTEAAVTKLKTEVK